MIPEGMTAEEGMQYWLTWEPEGDQTPVNSTSQAPPNIENAEPENSPEYKRLRAAAFLVTPDGEAECRFGALASIIIERDGAQWHAYRIRWYSGGKMQTYRTLYKGADYKAAVRKAVEFMTWLKTKRREQSDEKTQTSEAKTSA